MNIELQPIPLEDKPVLRNLMELCLHDSSEFNGDEVGEHGLFGYNYIDFYWVENGRFPFFVRVDGKLAGFVLVRTLDENTRSLAEFFILRKYRRKGIGRIVAHRVFNNFPGKWQIAQEAVNLPAQAFWRAVIGEYTNGRFQEITQAGWHGPIQEFHTP